MHPLFSVVVFLGREKKNVVVKSTEGGQAVDVPSSIGVRRYNYVYLYSTLSSPVL